MPSFEFELPDQNLYRDWVSKQESSILFQVKPWEKRSGDASMIRHRSR
nr:hypothetical protein [Collinsella vaginalis]